MRMAGGPGGKMVYLHLRSAENDYYNCYDVLQTKSNIRGVIVAIFFFLLRMLALACTTSDIRRHV